MQQLPTLAEIAHKLEEIVAEHVDFPRPLEHRAALAADLGLDSLDLIEASFCIQEHFDFEFSDKNPIEELDAALGGGLLIEAGKLTALGFQVLRQRMPELADRELPASMAPAEIQKYFSMETFARLIHEFLAAVPDHDPESGELVVLRDMVPCRADGTRLAPLPKGDDLLATWIEAQSERLRSH